MSGKNSAPSVGTEGRQVQDGLRDSHPLAQGHIGPPGAEHPMGVFAKPVMVKAR